MAVLRYVHLDVFTNQPFTGIQLAVFPDAAGIDERRMQRIANEMALPETTFVFPPEAPRFLAARILRHWAKAFRGGRDRWGLDPRSYPNPAHSICPAHRRHVGRCLQRDVSQ